MPMNNMTQFETNVSANLAITFWEADADSALLILSIVPISASVTLLVMPTKSTASAKGDAFARMDTFW